VILDLEPDQAPPSGAILIATAQPSHVNGQPPLGQVSEQQQASIESAQPEQEPQSAPAGKQLHPAHVSKHLHDSHASEEQEASPQPDRDTRPAAAEEKLQPAHERRLQDESAGQCRQEEPVAEQHPLHALDEAAETSAEFFTRMEALVGKDGPVAASFDDSSHPNKLSWHQEGLGMADDACNVVGRMANGDASGQDALAPVFSWDRGSWQEGAGPEDDLKLWTGKQQGSCREGAGSESNLAHWADNRHEAEALKDLTASICSPTMSDELLDWAAGADLEILPWGASLEASASAFAEEHSEADLLSTRELLDSLGLDESAVRTPLLCLDPETRYTTAELEDQAAHDTETDFRLSEEDQKPDVGRDQLPGLPEAIQGPDDQLLDASRLGSAMATRVNSPEAGISSIENVDALLARFRQSCAEVPELSSPEGIVMCEAAASAGPRPREQRLQDSAYGAALAAEAKPSGCKAGSDKDEAGLAEGAASRAHSASVCVNDHERMQQPAARICDDEEIAASAPSSAAASADLGSPEHDAGNKAKVVDIAAAGKLALLSQVLCKVGV
jgi:hypothetical protein